MQFSSFVIDEREFLFVVLDGHVLASRRQINALPVPPSGMGMGMACSTFLTVLFDAFGMASVKIRPDSIASTFVTNLVSYESISWIGKASDNRS